MSNLLSVIVPFHRDLVCLARCLTALDPLPTGSDLIIVADGAVDDCRQLAAAHRARVISIDGPSGPAVARNVGAAAATGSVLVFIDADVVVSPSGLTRMARILREQPQTAAVFGSYDELPADPGFMSQYKNLSHSFIHQTSTTNARTFWTGFGAVRRDAFERVGGFDERLPSVEDIDLGYRLTEAGYKIILDATLCACHLKRWTVWSTIVSDMRDRGIPWTQLILRYGALSDDLNLRTEYRWSVVLAYMALASLLLVLYDWRFLAGPPLLMTGLTVLNQRYYQFFYRKRGALFAVKAWFLHLLQHWYNGVSFSVGTALFLSARYLSLRLPGALSIDSWSATRSQSVRATRISPVWSTEPARD